MTTDFRQQLNELKNAADKEDYAKQLANIFLTANLDLKIKAILLMAMDYGAQSRWISVEEELPPIRETGRSDIVLVCTVEEKIGIAYYNHVNKAWVSLATRNVTHWMPLPPPPSVSSDDKEGGEL